MFITPYNIKLRQQKRARRDSELQSYWREHASGKSYTLRIFCPCLSPNNYYVYDNTGKRLCRRVASAFAEKYKNEIFDKKVLKVKEISDSWLNKVWRLDDLKYRSIISEFHGLRDRVLDYCQYCDLPAYYLAYGCLNSEYCYYAPSLADFWFARYECVTDGKEVCDKRFSEVTLPAWFTNALTRYFYIGQFLDNEERVLSDALKYKRSREVDYYRDLFKSIE